MSLVPKAIVDRIEYYETHLVAWSAHAQAIGTTPADVLAVRQLAEAAREAFDAQQAAQNAARSATAKLRLAMAALNNAGVGIIEQVRTKARSAGAGVYPLAQIPAPATPSRKEAPGKPYRLETELDALGRLRLTWKCDNPAGATGTVYQIWRRAEGGEDVYLGTCGKKRFVDKTVPRGASRLIYSIQAMRSTTSGDCAAFNVNFGVAPGSLPAEMQTKRAA